MGGTRGTSCQGDSRKPCPNLQMFGSVASPAQQKKVRLRANENDDGGDDDDNDNGNDNGDDQEDEK